jgi:hypothetical protein
MSIKNDYRKGEHGECQFAPLLWVVVMLLLLCAGGFAVLAGVLSLLTFSTMAMGAAVAVALFCAMLLGMLLIAGIALYAAQTCLAPRLAGSKYFQAATSVAHKGS